MLPGMDGWMCIDKWSETVLNLIETEILFETEKSEKTNDTIHSPQQ